MLKYEQVKNFEELLEAEKNNRTILIKPNRDASFKKLSSHGITTVKGCMEEYPHFSIDRYAIER